MRKFNLYSLILLVTLTVFSFSTVEAQDAMPQTDAPIEKGGNKRRAELLEELGLSPAQMQQFRRINGDRRPQMRAAQQRLKEATRALDEAVYADAPDESMIQMRIREAQAAQAEVIKIRSLTELAVRRILTAEQLTRFRDTRRRFEASVEERRLNKKENRMENKPNRRFGNRRQQRQRANMPPNN